MTGWAAFWLCAAVFVACEAWLYSKGHDTTFWQHKTPEELGSQRKQIEDRPTAKDARDLNRCSEHLKGNE